MKIALKGSCPLFAALLLCPLLGSKPSAAAAPPKTAPTPARPAVTVAGRWKTEILVQPNGEPYPADPTAKRVIPPLSELVLEQDGERVTGVLKTPAGKGGGPEGWNVEIQGGSFRDKYLEFTLKADGPKGPIRGGGQLIGNTLRGGIGMGRGDENVTWLWTAERIPDRTNSDPDGSVTGRWSSAFTDGPPFALPVTAARPKGMSGRAGYDMVLQQDGEAVTGHVVMPYIDGDDRLRAGIPVTGTFHEGRLTLVMTYQYPGRMPHRMTAEAFLKGDFLTGSSETSEGDSAFLSDWNIRRLAPSDPGTGAGLTGTWDVTLPDREGRMKAWKMLIAQNGPSVAGVLRDPKAGDAVASPPVKKYIAGTVEDGVLAFETDGVPGEPETPPLRHRAAAGRNTLTGSTEIPGGNVPRLYSWRAVRTPHAYDLPEGRWFLPLRRGGKSVPVTLTLRPDHGGWAGDLDFGGDRAGRKVPLRNLRADGETIRFWVPARPGGGERMEFAVKTLGEIMTGSVESPEGTALFSGMRIGPRVPTDSPSRRNS